MEKYSFEFKKKVVEEYLLGRGSTHELAKKYHIGKLGDHKQVLNWIALSKASSALERFDSFLFLKPSCFTPGLSSLYISACSEYEKEDTSILDLV